MGTRDSASRSGPAWLLGKLRLQHVRRPMAGTAVRGRLSTWQTATVAAVSSETARTRTLRLEVAERAGPGAFQHRAGQHVDVRLTADDGYQAERAYSIASPAGGPRVELTVERIDDGELSPYL